MEIYDVLHAEHRQLLENLEELVDAEGAHRRQLLEMVADEMSAHGAAEDQVLYDRLATNAHMHALILEAKQEHHVVGLLLTELLALDVDDERFAGKVKILRELIDAHIEGEEEDMFEEARRLTGLAAESLAGEYLNAREHVAELTPLARLAAVDRKNEQKQPAVRPADEARL